MKWESILKRKVGLVVPIARECMIAWSTDAEVGTTVELSDLHAVISDCYLDKLRVWVDEKHASPSTRGSVFNRYSNYWTGVGNWSSTYAGTLANLLIHNMDRQTNHWIRGRGRGRGRPLTTYIKVEAIE